MKEVVMKVDDEFWDNITQLTVFKEQKEIIHCKDCKYWQTSKIKGSKDYHTCMCVRLGKEGIIAFPDDFCSRGVKK